MNVPQETELILTCLSHGELSIDGQFMWGSNYTFLGNLIYKDHQFQVVFKPIEGEKPLWDFPTHTLAHREVAAFLLSEENNNYFIPPTVYRDDEKNGAGSLQLFVDHDPEYHYLNFTENDKLRARPIALFDAIINNTDRKGGHVIVGKDNNKMWCIDHGVSFHQDPKLRTVIWDFAGQPFSIEEINQLTSLKNKLQSGAPFFEQLQNHLSNIEIDAMMNRVIELLTIKSFPHPTESRMSYPWPPV
jgi:hypothetical protein